MTPTYQGRSPSSPSLMKQSGSAARWPTRVNAHEPAGLARKRTRNRRHSSTARPKTVARRTARTRPRRTTIATPPDQLRGHPDQGASDAAAFQVVESLVHLFEPVFPRDEIAEGQFPFHEPP